MILVKLVTSQLRRNINTEPAMFTSKFKAAGSMWMQRKKSPVKKWQMYYMSEGNRKESSFSAKYISSPPSITILDTM